jgi:hypothetical protein
VTQPRRPASFFFLGKETAPGGDGASVRRYAEVARVAGWDPRDNRAVDRVRSINRTPCLFAAADGDDLVPKKHAALLEAACACPHKMRFESSGRPPRVAARAPTPPRPSPRFEGTHNSTRPKIFLERAKTFIYLRLRLDRSPRVARRPFRPSVRDRDRAARRYGRDARDHAATVANPKAAGRPALGELSQNKGATAGAGKKKTAAPPPPSARDRAGSLVRDPVAAAP